MTAEQVQKALPFPTRDDPSAIAEDGKMTVGYIVAWDHVWLMDCGFTGGNGGLGSVTFHLETLREMFKSKKGYDARYFESTQQDTVTVASKAVAQALGSASQSWINGAYSNFTWERDDAVVELSRDYGEYSFLFLTYTDPELAEEPEG
jgi:hypothetical protein